MTGRAFVETLLALVLAFVIVVIALTVLDVLEGSEPLESALGALQTVGTLLALPLVASGLGWLIANIAARRGSSAKRFWINTAILFGVALLTAAVSFFVGVLAGGYGVLLAAVGIIAAIAFFGAGLIALVLVHLVFIRRASAEPQVMRVELAPNS